MLGDNIKETIAKLKQSAEGGLDAYKECILAETDRKEHAKWKERAEELEQVLADSLDSAAIAIASSTPPSVLALRRPLLCYQRPLRPLPRSHHNGLAKAAHAMPRFHPVQPEAVEEKIRHLLSQVRLRPLGRAQGQAQASSDVSSWLWRPGSCATRATTP